MKTNFKTPPREFIPIEGLCLKDMGDIYLEPNEQITFRTESNRGNDIVKTDWGFYLGNSINWTLKRQGFKTAIVLSKAGGNPRIFINLVEQGKIADFFDYLKKNDSEVISWLDEWFESKK
ncbi:MAG: hypothetical protein HQK96_20590 [Nitrospirae bacterium]|nr:hypothetical protein [Nitrospirota bacterium]